MARPKQDKEISRKKVISLYLTDTELSLIKENAASAQLTLEGKVETRYTFSPQVSELVPILSQLGKIGSNLNQISRYFNSGGDPTDDIKRELRQCMAKLMDLRNELAQLNR